MGRYGRETGGLRYIFSSSPYVCWLIVGFLCQATRAKAVLEGIPADVEETIVRLEKRSKDMEKNSNSAASKQKMLKGLLERL